MTDVKPPRAEMADRVDRVIATYRTDATITKGLYPDEEAQATFAADELEPVAAELRKSCAGCRHFSGQAAEHEFDGCAIGNNSPADGTGYCSHGWEAKRDDPIAQADTKKGTL